MKAGLRGDVRATRSDLRRPRGPVIAAAAAGQALVVDYVAAGLERDGIAIVRGSLDDDQASWTEMLEGFDGEIDAMLALVDDRSLAVALSSMRAARRRWSRCALVAVATAPDVRLLGA
jgi:hypothetical protein